MHTSYAAYSKSLSDIELAREADYAKQLPEENPMRQALATERLARETREVRV